MLLLFFIYNSLTKKAEDQVQNDYYIITNQIKKNEQIGGGRTGFFEYSENEINFGTSRRDATKH